MSAHVRIKFLLIAALACSWQCSTSAAQTNAIRFAAEVPRAPEEMQVFKLTPSRPPLVFLNEKLRQAKLTPLKTEGKAFMAREASSRNERDRVRAFVDPQSGDSQLTPNFADLVRSGAPHTPLAGERAASIAASALNDERFIPRDATKLRVADGITVMAGTTPRAQKPGVKAIEPRSILTIVPAVRYAAGFRVYGQGSHAVISIANNGVVVGALRRWRTASEAERVPTIITSEQARESIERQLRPMTLAEGTKATVDKIDIAYYDANANYLQPVYRFEATITPANERVSPIKVAGYVPLAKELEPIPDLSRKPEGPAPRMPKQDSRQNGAGTPDDISLGEYANQDWPNDSGYVSMSNSFLRGLTFLNGFFPGITPPVNRTQWYVAYPWEVVGPSSKYFMNAVDVAYTVPHGDWLINTTKSNNADFWDVRNIGTGGNPGYGAAAGGVLATWVIMSCEVIPSMYDRQNESGGSGNPYTAFDAWWPVFQGLHNAIGFRTIMFYPDDDLQFGFGLDASVGGDLNGAWFQEVSAYDGDDGTYASQHLTGKIPVHYDRASTMIDARDLGQSIYNVRPQSASSTLWNFWMGN